MIIPEIDKLVKEVVEANYNGSIKSIVMLWIDTDNDFKMSYHVPSDTLLAALGGLTVIGNNITTNGLKQIPTKDYLK